MMEPEKVQSQSALLPPPTALAEQGKVHALEANHSLALVYYRAAMHQASESTRSNQILSRYFAECALESFEQMKDYDSVLAYCDQAITHYEANPPSSPIAWKDLASMYQRRTIVHLKRNESDQAEKAIHEVKTIAREQSLNFPLIETISNWLRAKLHIDPQRLESVLQQKGYYAITPKTVDPKIAAKLPPHILQSFQPGSAR